MFKARGTEITLPIYLNLYDIMYVIAVKRAG